MTAKLLQRLGQLYCALDVSRDLPVTKDSVSTSTTDTNISVLVDYSKGLNREELDNQKSLIVGLIGSLKDHLKVWCRDNSVSFEGDDLIDSNQSVALIHDLWNLDKHAELNRPPRSGVTPRVVGLRTTLSIEVGPGASVNRTIDMKTGSVSTKSNGNVQISYRIVGRIEDEAGNDLGGFLETCELAVSAWEAVIKKAGVPYT